MEKRLEELNDELADLQRVLYAHDSYALLLVFQAMDAAGKDGTIRKVLRGVNPAGCQVFSFKQPSKEELDHDFLWRITKCLPERGRIGVFNRSHYEEVLVVRVHPEYLEAQKLTCPDSGTDAFWTRRLAAISSWERHLADTGTVVLKFFLNVSLEEQRQRFLSRLDEPEKHWKFSVGDVRERGLWDKYMAAYEAALTATSRPWAPWYSIPADDKNYMRMTVADIVVRTLQRLPLSYPRVAEKDRARFDEMRTLLESDKG
jgi:PPK2 family polyphosphate:nucleotide phosphotransferase